MKKSSRAGRVSGYKGADLRSQNGNPSLIVENMLREDELSRRQGVASADFKPTDQQLEVQKLLEEQLQTAQSQLGELLDRDLAAFSELLRTRNVSNIIAPVPTR